MTTPNDSSKPLPAWLLADPTFIPLPSNPADLTKAHIDALFTPAQQEWAAREIVRLAVQSANAARERV